MPPRSRYYDLFDYHHFECDIMYKPHCIGLGIQLGTNSYKGGKRDNLYLDVQLLYWTFGFEVKNLRKDF